MRLLNEADNRSSPCETRTRVNAALRSNCCIRENYVKDVIEMNEKKCCQENSRPSMKLGGTSCPKLRSLSPIREDHSDSGEELQYGPGIVNKLRSKYMSMTLRENGKKRARPPLSNLRKASSLDNLLDDQSVAAADESKTYQISSVISCVNKLDYSNKESSSCVTVNFCADLKRTRSMEALLDEKSPSNIKSVVISKTKITNHANPIIAATSASTSVSASAASATSSNDDINIPLDSIVNEDVIIVENLISGIKNKEKRHRSSLESTELPPPDVVKETLKIFENRQRRPAAAVKNWRQVKCESVRKSSAKPQLYPKPILDNKVTIRTSEDNVPGDNGSGNGNGNGNGIRRDHTLLSSIKVNFESNKEARHRTTTLSHTTCIRNDMNSINVNVKTSAVLANGGAAAAAAAAAVNNNLHPKKAFRENGFVVVDKCRSVEGDCRYRDILKPAPDSLPPKQIGIIRPLVTTVAKQQLFVSSSSPPMPAPAHETDANNLVSVAKKTRPADRSKDENGGGCGGCDDDDDDEDGEYSKSIDSSSNSSSELCIPAEQQVIQNLIGKPSTLLIKGAWNQQQNSMIFNFKDRKEVPDYIENDGLPLTTHRNRTKRILDENGGTAGYIILGTENVVDESTTDSTYFCPETQTLSRSPSPNSVRFKGDNVLIDGKSNLKKFPREKNLRIQFNDTCTIFEYPSEASLLEEDCATNSKKEDETTAAASKLKFSSNDSLSFSSENSRMHNPLNGGSGLASYVPSKLGVGMNESFQLGVTKSSNASVASYSCSKDSSTMSSTTTTTTTTNRTIHDHRSNSGNPVDVVESYAPDSAMRCQSNENIVNDYLKPAADGENIAWSEESIPDLLF